MKKIFAALALLALLFVGACGSSGSGSLHTNKPIVGSTVEAPKAPEEPAKPAGHSFSETVYLETLDSGGIDYSTEDAAIRAAYSVCDGMNAGMSDMEIIDAIMQGGWSAHDAGYILGAVQGSGIC